MPIGYSVTAQNRPHGWVEDYQPLPDVLWKVLYHFTSRQALPAIMELGISKGDVPITPHGGYNAPWLTTDPSWDVQGWSKGSAIDKTAVRLIVHIPDCPLLRHWPAIAQSENMDPAWFSALSRAGSGSANDWYVFMGRVPPAWIHQVDYRDGNPEAWGMGKSPSPG